MVKCVALTNFAACPTPLKVTVAVGTKLVPWMASVCGADPATIEEGTSTVMAGAGLGPVLEAGMGRPAPQDTERKTRRMESAKTISTLAPLLKNILTDMIENLADNQRT